MRNLGQNRNINFKINNNKKNIYMLSVIGIGIGLDVPEVIGIGIGFKKSISCITNIYIYFFVTVEYAQGLQESIPWAANGPRAAS